MRVKSTGSVLISMCDNSKYSHVTLACFDGNVLVAKKFG